MYFKCETFDNKGNIIHTKNVEVSVLDVQDAAKHETVTKLRKKAQQQGFGFRVKRIDD